MPARVWYGVTLGSVAALVLALGIVVSPATASARSGVAPGAPGAASDWVTGDKDGFGTARGTGSKVWYTLHNGELSEIYYPRIETPSWSLPTAARSRTGRAPTRSTGSACSTRRA